MGEPLEASKLQSFVSHPLIYPDTVEEREYQRKIAESSFRRNTLVVLPTAMGKTIISARAVAELLYSQRRKRVLVMAPTRPLILQHRRSFESIIRLTEDDFVLLSGKTPSEYRSSVWAGRQRLVFATPEVVRNDMLRGMVDFEEFGLLVFDECHRAVKEYAYTAVAEGYLKASRFPTILALTASPGSETERVAEVCESLAIEHIEYRSELDEDVRPYINPVSLEWRSVDLPSSYGRPRALLRMMLDSRIRALQARGHLKKSAGFVSRKDLLELGFSLRYEAELSIEEERGPLYSAVSLQSQALTLFHMIELLDTQGPSTLRRFIERAERERGSKGRNSVATEANGELEPILEALEEHPKVGLLKDVVSRQLQANGGSRIMVFTQYRDTASHLVEELNAIQGVRAERFVGQAARPGDPGLRQEKQASLLEDLRRGFINTLCATSIAEEGLDIPEVDLVVFYEPVPSEIRSIQRMGRTGRRSAGKVIVLATEGTSDTAYLRVSQERTERMKSLLAGLSGTLRAVPRSGEAPPSEYMTEEELARLVKPTALAEGRPSLAALQSTAAHEGDRMKAFERLVRRAEQIIYMRALESGPSGLNSEELYRELEEERGCPRRAAVAAVRRLAKQKVIAPPGERIAPLAREIPGTSLMTVQVERVGQGSASVLVDGRQEARLEYFDYEGPRQLIKKGATFKALCQLRESAGTFTLRVRRVVESG